MVVGGYGVEIFTLQSQYAMMFELLGAIHELPFFYCDMQKNVVIARRECAEAISEFFMMKILDMFRDCCAEPVLREAKCSQ